MARGSNKFRRHNRFERKHAENRTDAQQPLQRIWAKGLMESWFASGQFGFQPRVIFGMICFVSMTKTNK
jgi:hypothetical protein